MQEHVMMYHEKDQKFSKVFQRNAVRAIISNEQGNLLLIKSNLGDYKFPGGGIEEGENENQALIREIKEECGFDIEIIQDHVFRIIELKEDKKDKTSLFKMKSDYFTCSIDDTKSHELNLDEYEKELGFEPFWIDISEAIESNKRIISDNTKEKAIWIKRDTYVLELLEETRS